MPTDTASTARFTIPDDWLIGATCPVCGYPKLIIEHFHDQPDQLACSVCATHYQVAQDGVHVRLLKFSSRLPQDLGERWLKPAEISEIALRIRREADASAPTTQPAGEISLALRAKRLAELGNPPQKIREILLRLPGVAPAQVDEVLTPVEKKVAHKGGSVLWVITTALLTVMILVVVVMLILPMLGAKKDSTTNNGAPNNNVTENNTNGSTNNNNTNNTKNNSPFFDPTTLPAPLQTLIPAGMKILKPTPVTVRQLDPKTQPQVRCPGSPGEAAKLFGGSMQDWSAASQGIGWIMISLQTQTITIPKDMSAGYLEVSGSPEMSSVIGPAVIQNVNFVAVSCQ
jgi:hypothetical protein